MIAHAEWLLVGAVAAVGVLHTMVPDHWVPITLIARQQGWNERETARAALVAGTGHTISTLLIGLVVWVAGVTFATKFGNLVSIVSSIALIAFGCWIALSSLRELRSSDEYGDGYGHSHGLDHGHGHGHGREPSYGEDDAAQVGPKQTLSAHVLHKRGGHHDVSEDEPYVPGRSGTGVLTKHRHAHRHAGSTVHIHTHDHDSGTWHRADIDSDDPPGHEHRHERSFRTTLLLILGSSPMVEGIPAFFAAGKFGPALIAVMAVVFAIATIGTYVVLCVSSVAGLQHVRFGSLERYGEVLSGAFIAIVGFVFLFFPLL